MSNVLDVSKEAGTRGLLVSVEQNCYSDFAKGGPSVYPNSGTVMKLVGE